MFLYTKEWYMDKPKTVCYLTTTQLCFKKLTPGGLGSKVLKEAFADLEQRPVVQPQNGGGRLEKPGVLVDRRQLLQALANLLCLLIQSVGLCCRVGQCTLSCNTDIAESQHSLSPGIFLSPRSDDLPHVNIKRANEHARRAY